MKLSLLNAIKVGDIELELENLKKKILEEEGPSDPITCQTIEGLNESVDQEIINAFISIGLH